MIFSIYFPNLLTSLHPMYYARSLLPDKARGTVSSTFTSRLFPTVTDNRHIWYQHVQRRTNNHLHLLAIVQPRRLSPFGHTA